MTNTYSCLYFNDLNNTQVQCRPRSINDNVLSRCVLSPVCILSNLEIAAWDRDVASVEISRLCWTVRGDYGSQVFSECMVSTNTPRLVAAKRVTLVIKSSS